MAFAAMTESVAERGALDQATVYLVQAFNAVLNCCWATAARELLAEDGKYDLRARQQAVSAVTLWAAGLGSASAKDLLGELAAKRSVPQTSPPASITFADVPPWIRPSVAERPHE